MKLSPEDRAWIDLALQAIAADEAGPSEADIAHAPVLSDWKPLISPLGHVMLWSEVVGHPILGNSSITTSQLIAINPGGRLGPDGVALVSARATRRCH